MSDYKMPAAPRPTPHPLPEGLAGVRLMCDTAPNHVHRALYAFGGFLGLRVSESLSIRPSSFNLERMEIRVVGKGGKVRILPVTTVAWYYIKDAYQAALEGDKFLVPMSDGGARHAIRERGRILGFSQAISSHDLRATFATEMYNKTLNIRAVQEALGHSSVATTEIYTKISIDAIREAMNF